jgi:hypothetical protein
MKKYLIIVACLCLMSIDSMAMRNDKDVVESYFHKKHYFDIEYVKCYYCAQQQAILVKKGAETFTLRCKYPECGKETVYWHKKEMGVIEAIR